MSREKVSVLVVGGGGREHALAWKLAKSDLVRELWVWPGNPLSLRLGKALPLDKSAPFEALAAAIADHGIDLVVCGPETPLSEGLADVLSGRGIPIFGPVAAAARLEASKEFAKEVMEAAGIPTARYQTATSRKECAELARTFLARDGKVVLKASGLAAGKGVFICSTETEITAALERLYATSMREAAKAVVVEEFLIGRESSYFTLIGADGSTPLGFAVDYKRLGDADVGPNTGGMGCYTPVPWLPVDAEATIERLVVAPLLRELKRREISYCGFLYVGLMWTNSGPKVVEFNARLGDPEAQILCVHDERDWLPLIACKTGVGGVSAEFEAESTRRGSTVGVVMAAEGYPYDSPSAGAVKVFQSRELADGDIVVFGASLRESDGVITSGGGRVLCVVATSSDGFSAARDAAYGKVVALASGWPGCLYRRDIAADARQGGEA